MKKVLSVLISFILVFSMTQAVFAERPIKVVVGGEPIESDVAPTVINGRTLLPVRAVFESIGAKVDYIASEQKVVAEKDGREVSFVIGSNVMTVNGADKEIDVAATIVNNRTLVPLRACAEAFDLEVKWDDLSRTARVKAETLVVSEETFSWGTNTYTYDENGNCILSEGSNGFWEKYEYDANGNMTYSEKSSGEWTKYTYNQYGELTSSESSSGYSMSCTYDDNGNMTYEQTSNNTWTKYTYNEKNLLIEKESQDGQKTAYTYDESGKLIEDVSTIPTNDSAAKNTYEYDANGKLIRHYSHSDDWTFTYQYDENGNLVHEKSTYAGLRMGEMTYIYDEFGFLIREEFPEAEYYGTYEYDEDGWLKFYSNTDGRSKKYIRVIK